MRHPAFHALLLAGLVAALPVRAQEQPPSESKVADQAADQLFREGQTLLQAGKFSEACLRFERSLRIEQALGTLLNLAYCHEHEGRLGAAWDEYRQAAELARGRNEARYDFAVRRRQEVEKRLAHVVFAVPTGQRMSDVRLDDQPVKLEADGSFFAEPGPHVVSVGLRDGERLERMVTFAAGTERIELPAARENRSGAAAPPPPASSPPGEATASPSPKAPPDASSSASASSSSATTRRTLGWVAAGVGVVGLGLGTYFGIETFAIRNSAADNGGCNGNQCTPQALDRIQGPATTTALLSTIGIGVGIVGAGVGTWLLLTSGPGAPQAAARIVPAVGPGSGGLRVEGLF